MNNPNPNSNSNPNPNSNPNSNSNVSQDGRNFLNVNENQINQNQNQNQIQPYQNQAINNATANLLNHMVTQGHMNLNMNVNQNVGINYNPQQITEINRNVTYFDNQNVTNIAYSNAQLRAYLGGLNGINVDNNQNINVDYVNNILGNEIDIRSIINKTQYVRNIQRILDSATPFRIENYSNTFFFNVLNKFRDVMETTLKDSPQLKFGNLDNDKTRNLINAYDFIKHMLFNIPNDVNTFNQYIGKLSQMLGDKFVLQLLTVIESTVKLNYNSTPQYLCSNVLAIVRQFLMYIYQQAEINNQTTQLNNALSILSLHSIHYSIA